MRARGRVRPSKPVSAIAFIVGIVFVVIGFFIFSRAGIFGVFWTLAALAITCYHAINLFTDHGIAIEVVDFDTSTQPRQYESPTKLAEQRLASLDELKRKGLITPQEYEEQRKRILEEI